MSASCMDLAFRTRGASPLGKLILIRFADSTADGCGEIRVDDLAEFCGVAPEDVYEAVEALVAGGHLVRHGANWFSMSWLPAEPMRRRGYKTKSVSKSVRATVYDRDGGACKTCGATDDLSVDHIVPQRRGGTHALDNLQTLCRSCNARKGTRHG